MKRCASYVKRGAPAEIKKEDVRAKAQRRKDGLVAKAFCDPSAVIATGGASSGHRGYDIFAPSRLRANNENRR
jgi:hypothetical protein